LNSGVKRGLDSVLVANIVRIKANMPQIKARVVLGRYSIRKL